MIVDALLTLREKLDIIDGWLLEDDGDQLADILSIVRGPDEEDLDKEKDTMTNPLRKAAFPKTFEAAMEGVIPSWYVLMTKSFKMPHSTLQSHFYCHIRRAARVLCPEKEV